MHIQKEPSCVKSRDGHELIYEPQIYVESGWFVGLRTVIWIIMQLKNPQ